MDKPSIFPLINKEEATRRSFLQGLGKVGLVMAAPSLVAFPKKLYTPPLEIKTPIPPSAGLPDLSLNLYNTHTGESLKKHVFWSDGSYIPDQLKILTHFFRDHRNGKKHEIDPTLLKLLSGIAEKLESKEAIHLISGYRSPSSNQMLCAKSNGVAKISQHLHGKAADIMIPGKSMKQLQAVAKSLKAGGVGRYASFVHVDTGRVRYWGLA